MRWGLTLQWTDFYVLNRGRVIPAVPQYGLYKLNRAEGCSLTSMSYSCSYVCPGDNYFFPQTALKKKFKMQLHPDVHPSHVSPGCWRQRIYMLALHCTLSSHLNRQPAPGAAPAGCSPEVHPLWCERRLWQHRCEGSAAADGCRSLLASAEPRLVVSYRVRVTQKDGAAVTNNYFHYQWATSSIVCYENDHKIGKNPSKNDRNIKKLYIIVSIHTPPKFIASLSFFR